jgi:amino acid adenylation domain-containing protein
MVPGNTLHSIFEARAYEAPDRIAVFCAGEEITYGELNRRAEQLAGKLRAMRVGPDVLVGLCLERKLELIIGMLAILKAGGAYVPIDPSYPAKRIEFLCEDSAAAVIVTETATLSCLGQCKTKIICIDQDATHGPQPPRPPLSAALARKGKEAPGECNLAYVIYTSGSTGTPKGVLVEHRHVVRLFEQTQHKFGFNRNDVWTMFHSVSFDFSVWEIWGALLHGGTLVIVPSELTRSPGQFHALLREKKVTVLNQTPSAFRQLVAADMRISAPSGFALRFIIFGGEALDVKLLEPWSARYGNKSPALINMYGITETTVHVTYKRLEKEDLVRHDVNSIGTPIPDLRIHLLDDAGRPVPDGVPGEMYVSGAGVARGYLNRPKLTVERFVQQGATRMYRSGDRAVRLPNGEYQYLGRADDQIKVRGFRIEPYEVELCLCGHAEVASAIVAPHDYGDGDVRLIAYIVPRHGAATDGAVEEKITADLNQHATKNLPLHMRPSAYFLMPEIPLTAHGKADRAALRELVARQQRTHTPSVSVSSTEKVVTEIWEEILQKRDIGAKDDFFDLGGTSLALIRIFARVNDRFKLSLNGSILAEEATVARLVSCIDEQLAAGFARQDSYSNGTQSSSKTPTEQIIVQIWEDILQKKNIGTKDDFFDLGGTSLALIRIFSRVNAHFNISLDGSILAEEATVSRLASCVDAKLEHHQAQVQVLGRT